MLTDSDIAVRADNKVGAEIGDEVVILDIETGHYFQLNVTSTRIWKLLESPRSIGEICGTLEAAFEIDAETCRTDVISFIEMMRDKKLLRIGT